MKTENAGSKKGGHRPEESSRPQQPCLGGLCNSDGGQGLQKSQSKSRQERENPVAFGYLRHPFKSKEKGKEDEK